VGGAERQLVALAGGLRRAGHEVSVAVFYAGGAFEEELLREGVGVRDLAKRGRWDVVPFLTRTAALIRRERPDVVHSYLDSPNLVAALQKLAGRSVKIVWGLRSSKDDHRDYHWLSGVAAQLERIASPLADAIIANSEAGRRRAVEAGFRTRRIFVVPNGIDCERFYPDPSGRERIRAEWCVPATAPLVGLVARFDPVKDHTTFLRAAAEVAARRAEVRFACVGGGGSPEYHARLRQLAAELGLASRLTWTGERPVTRGEYSAFDVAVLSSRAGEGFPNVVAEAMACGRPVVATDSGDVRAIVGDAGSIVPPRDPEALAAGILELLARPGGEAAADLSRRARERIDLGYSVSGLVRRTADVLQQVRTGT
jgi:glycosyltransferase involved in cell wall biosynthesis